MKVLKRLVDAKALFDATNGEFGISVEEFEKQVKAAGDKWTKTKVLVEVPEYDF